MKTKIKMVTKNSSQILYDPMVHISLYHCLALITITHDLHYYYSQLLICVVLTGELCILFLCQDGL